MAAAGEVELRCSFCGLTRPGGVRGPAKPGPRQDVYICRDCIQLCSDIVASHEDQDGE